MNSILKDFTTYQKDLKIKSNVIQQQQQGFISILKQQFNSENKEDHKINEFGEKYSSYLLDVISAFLEILHQFSVSQDFSNKAIAELETKLKNFKKSNSIYSTLDQEFDFQMFNRINELIEFVLHQLVVKKYQIVICTWSVLMTYWIDLYLVQRMSKIQFLPKFWQVKFYLCQEKPPAKCANESQDLSQKEINKNIELLNNLIVQLTPIKLTKSQHEKAKDQDQEMTKIQQEEQECSLFKIF